MSRWRVVPSAKDIVIREKDWTAQFECHNVDTGAVLKIEFTQSHGGPVSDIIGALKSLAQVILRAALAEEGEEADEDASAVKPSKLN